MGAANAERIVHLHEAGWSYGDLATSFGSTRSAIAGLIWRARNPRQRSNGRGRHGKRGERNGNARLTADEVSAIRKRREAGEQLRDLAAEYGVHYTHVHLICSRKRWAHVQ